jgi:CRISPR-associated protein Csx10
VELTIRLELLSDYHVGAGHGLGAVVDSALLRDGDGVPVLRGSLLAGLLRDGLRELLKLPPLTPHRRCRASGLAAGEGDPYCSAADPCPVCRVFGSPQSARRWRVGSARPVEAAVPQDEPRWAGRAAQAIQRVRVNPRTRRAERRKLFSQEEGDRRLTFVFTVSCLGDDAWTEAEAALVLAAARNVRALGGSRRRGRGECRLHLVNRQEEERLLEVFRTCWLEGQAPRTEAVQARARAAVSPTDRTAPLRIRLIARTDEPVVVAERAESGNQLASLGYIPGPALLGALAVRAASLCGLEWADHSPSYRDFVEVFRRGGIRFSPLYPAKRIINDLYPCIPWPRDLLTCQVFPGFAHERDAHGASGWAAAAEPPWHCEQCAAQDRRDVPLKALGGFVRMVPDDARLHPPELREEMHVRIDPRTHRASRGDLFGYTALEVGQFLIGEMVCAGEHDWELLCELCELPGERQTFEVRVGRASRRGYGRLTLWLEKLPAERPTCWQGADLAERVRDPGAPLTLTLLTDAVLTDPWGRFRQRLDEEGWLSGLLGTAVRVRSSYSMARPVDGFNTHLGLPRWRDVALQAGSSVGFVAAGPADAGALLDRLRQLERDGIGLRRQEGFGQVVFNHPVYTGCAGLSDVAIPLTDERLRLAPAAADVPLVRERDFLRSWWQRQLDEGLKEENFRDPAWAPVARWVRSHAREGLPALRAALNNWGEPDNLLGAPFQRDKPNPFEGKGKAGREQLGALLDRLEQQTADGRLLARALEMLAERVAGLVKQERD